MLNQIRQAIRNDLETSEEQRRFGSGWMSGVLALITALAALLLVLSGLFPGQLQVALLNPFHTSAYSNLAIQVLLLLGFSLSLINLILRRNKVLGFSALILVLATTCIGQLSALHPVNTTTTTNTSSLTHLPIGIDWFVLNLLLTGCLFIPIEKLFGRLAHQPLFRQDWREDLFYFLISSLFVQTLTYLSLAPSMAILEHTQHWSSLRSAVASQPLWLQILEIMFLTDFMQYWFHRAFHQIGFLWKFHAVHHSAQAMDWLAGSRMHLVEIIGLRGITIIPMYILGFAESALHIYIFFVYLNATYIHANVRFNIEALKAWIVTPRFHHWHHGIEKEAIDVNFAIHFPWLDRLFGTYYMPPNRWPSGYGVGGHPVPNGYLSQFMYPFRSAK